MCAAVLAQLRLWGDDRFLPSMLTALVRRDTPALGMSTALMCQSTALMCQSTALMCQSTQSPQRRRWSWCAPCGTGPRLQRATPSHLLRDDITSITPHRHEDRARALLKFLAVLVDVDKLYKAALGTYDFDLAVMVAQVRGCCRYCAIDVCRWRRRTPASTCQC